MRLHLDLDLGVAHAAGVSSDERANNVVIEVQFDKVGSELVGHREMGRVRSSSQLKIKEQLHGRMVNVKETSM